MFVLNRQLLFVCGVFEVAMSYCGMVVMSVRFGVSSLICEFRLCPGGI